jgi:hypothetical protein
MLLTEAYKLMMLQSREVADGNPFVLIACSNAQWPALRSSGVVSDLYNFKKQDAYEEQRQQLKSYVYSKPFLFIEPR